MSLSNSKVKECLNLGWSNSQISKGYDVFEVRGSSSVIDGALAVEMIADVDMYKSDWEACRQAEIDGVKFINDIEVLEKGVYVDTHENRQHCITMLEKYPHYNVNNMMKKDGEDSPYWVRYKNYYSL